MTDIVLSVASKVAEYLVALRRHSSYVMFSGSYTGQLKEELEKLENARQRVQLSIDEAQQEMKLIKAHPEKWVIEVKNVVEMAQNALKHDEGAKKTFFFGWLPNLKERYRLGREVTRTVRDIEASIRQGQLEMVYCRHAPSRHVVGALDVNSSADHWGDTVIESRASILEKIMNDLDDEKLKVIGIYGQDGVGKTNLLEEVEKKLRSEKRLFDVIAKVRVSQTLKNIQDGIAYAFSLNLKDELSEEGRRNRLFREIQSDPTKKVLIILEDLWRALDLKKVGIPSGYESRGCKLLLTSRFEDVLAKEMHADRTIHLEGLKNDEPFKLFEKIVGDRLKDEKLKPIAAKVVKKLAEMQRLVHLEEIQVCECNSMEAIAANAVGKVEVVDDLVELPNVRRLDLRKLGNMMSFFNRGERAAIQVVFSSLEALHISGIGYIKMIWDNHVASSFPRCFQYLKTLDVSCCEELSNMFTPIIVGNLVELTKLRISNCNKLTEVISDEGGKEGPVGAFKQLKYIQLEKLRGLTCFSSGRYILMFPLLEDIIVTECPNIKFFSEAPIRAPKLKKVQGLTATWFCNGNINNTIPKMAMDDGVEFMHLYQAKGHSDLISKPSRQLKSLVVDGCSFFNAIPSGLMDKLDKINTLQVQDCEQLEEIFGLENLVAKKSTQGLPQLWALNLINLPKLRQLWNKAFQGILCFSSLSYLTLYRCNNLRHAFAPSMARCLPMLQRMEIKECDQMEGVIAEEKVGRSVVEKITFPILRWIELECLPNMTAFPSRMNHALECPVLQELTIAHCPKMIMFTWQSLMKFGQGISSPLTPQLLFPHLKSMVLSHMDQHSQKEEPLDKL